MEDAEHSADEGVRSAMMSFVSDVAHQLVISVHAQKETFGASRALYILNRGIVSRSEQILKSGAVWGLDFVLVNERLIERAPCFAMTYVEVTLLNRVEFMQLVEKHKDSCPDLQVRLRRFCLRLSAQRIGKITGKQSLRLKKGLSEISM